MKHKTSIYWADRAMIPMLGFDPLQVKNGVGYANGFVCCAGNFDAVDSMRAKLYEYESLIATHRLPIWC